jgi:hypothetical protein
MFAYSFVRDDGDVSDLETAFLIGDDDCLRPAVLEMLCIADDGAWLAEGVAGRTGR